MSVAIPDSGLIGGISDRPCVKCCCCWFLSLEWVAASLETGDIQRPAIVKIDTGNLHSSTNPAFWSVYPSRTTMWLCQSVQ